MNSKRFSSGFTLIELLVTVSIIAVLAGLATAGAQRGLAKAKETREISAARNLITSYLSVLTDTGGQCLPGYDRTVKSLTLPDGSVVAGVSAQRYPFRLAPYFNYQFKGTIEVNDNVSQLEAARKNGNYNYMASVCPALGINGYMVGGNKQANGKTDYESDCATTQARGGANLLVFVSAGGPGGMKGYDIVTPPNLTEPRWSKSPWVKGVDPSIYGNVDARHDGRAICAFFDGSIRSHSIDELRDMRLWSANAATYDDRDYIISQ